MNYTADPDAPAYDEEELPFCPTMDQLQDYYNTGSRYADKPADDDEEEQDDGPAWD